MAEKYKRHIHLKSVTNLRDIGGYKARNGKTIVWRRIFRSGEFVRLTGEDLQIIKEEIKPASLLDLRSPPEVERQGIGLISEADIRYHSIPFVAGTSRAEDEKFFRECTNMGDFYLHIVRHRSFGSQIVAALDIIAKTENHPLVFHCAVGKDRTGILSAMLMSILGVADKDIMEDYSLSGPYMEELLKNVSNDPGLAEAAKALPSYFWKASPESMELFLTTLRRDYGSIEVYLKDMGMEKTLPERLKETLLT